MNLNHYKSILLAIINKDIPQCTVYLFGSRARNTHQEGADIDIALDAGKKIDFSIISKIITDIEESRVPVLVDIVDLHNVSDAMKNEIKKEGILWKN